MCAVAAGRGGTVQPAAHADAEALRLLERGPVSLCGVLLVMLVLKIPCILHGVSIRRVSYLYCREPPGI